MDDTVLAVLPSEIAAEAQALRLDRVLRHRQLMQERLLRETGMLSAILLQSSGAFHCYFHPSLALDPSLPSAWQTTHGLSLFQPLSRYCFILNCLQFLISVSKPFFSLGGTFTHSIFDKSCIRNLEIPSFC